jgi:hypothetical protein
MESAVLFVDSAVLVAVLLAGSAVAVLVAVSL